MFFLPFGVSRRSVARHPTGVAESRHEEPQRGRLEQLLIRLAAAHTGSAALRPGPPAGLPS